MKIHTAVFSYNKETKTFSAEASDLRIQPGVVLNTIDLISTQSGRSVRCHLSSILRDREGEIQAWEYIPENNIFKKVIIFND